MALVDDSDYLRVARFKWHAVFNRGKWYARGRPQYPVPRNTVPVSLYRYILGVAAGVLVDHKDGNGLNCQRENMRQSNNLGNARNRTKPFTNTSGYKGARELNGRFYAYIRIGKPKHFGGFNSLEDAARGYDALAREHFGEFANVNFPDT